MSVCGPADSPGAAWSVDAARPWVGAADTALAFPDIRFQPPEALAVFDLLIRGGLIVDGTGVPGRHGDVAISNGQVTSIGNHSGAAARRTIDADGLVVAPGIVDVQSHMYPSVPDLAVAGQNTEDPRPYFLCEYAHAMGQGPGNLEEYWETIRAHHPCCRHRPTAMCIAMPRRCRRCCGACCAIRSCCAWISVSSRCT